MYQPPPANRSTFESQAQYNLQATQDIEDEQQSLEEEKKRRFGEVPKKPNYRPKPLRWPFIVCIILVLSLLMGLVIFARTTMPNSDSTATIEPRHNLMYRQDGSSSERSSSAAPQPAPSPSLVSSQLAPASSTPAAAADTPTQAVVPSSTADLPKSEPQAPVTSMPAAAAQSSAAPPRSESETSSASASEKKKNENPASDVASDTAQRVVPSTSPENPSSAKPSAPLPDPKTSSPAPNESSSATAKGTTSEKGTTSMKEISSSKEPSTSVSGSANMGNMNETPNHASTTPSDTSSVASSSTDLSDQRVAPPVTTTTLSMAGNTSPPPTPSRDDEIISVITSKFTSTITRPGSTLTYTTQIVANVSSTYTTILKTTLPGTTGETTFTKVITTSIPRTITRSAAVTYSMVTTIIPESTQTRTDTITDEKTTYYQTTTKTVARVTTSTAAYTAPVVVETSFEQVESTYTSTAAFTMPERTSDYTSVVVTALPTTFAIVATTAQPGQVYVQVGTTEITKIITVPGTRGQGSPQTQQPVIMVVTSVYDGRVETIVDQGAPKTIVTNDGGVFTAVFTPPAETKVVPNGGQETQMVITVTPSPQAAYVAVPTTINGTPTVVMIAQTLGTAGPGGFKEVATTINGKATVVNVPVTPEPVLVAVQTTIDGKPTVLLVESTPTAMNFSPISLTLVSQIGGSTGVFTTTDAPETIRTTVDGKETTVVRTPQPRVFTSVSGGTPTTMAVVTTPTGTMPLSFTVITTIGGTLSTIISTPEPTTLTTSISGTLRTITSTPTPTTRLSTMQGSTAVFTSTSRPTSTDSPDTVITQVERFGFTDGEYFVGKFLPVILAVMIAVPLRIIDLNAKLYQPFHALAQEGGSLGKNSLTLQFDGWKGFLAPFDVLMQGHPVPFITTSMIWCSSLLAPLATEAIGMKLHGTCKITAIEGCGIQLGVSTTSAHALVALLAFIIVLLLILIFCLREWETGLHANPWSIAGISSLARNADIRSNQIDFKASKKAMAEKRYGFGYFENNLGHDEYGIVYYDDSAHSLQGASASGALPVDDELTGAHQRGTGKGKRKPVPFIALTYWWRLLFIFFLASLFVIILYYHITLEVRTSFKDFMDSQTFGVRFFVAALGVIIIFCWESIFVSIAIISPYHHMGRRSQAPEKSILLTRPTNVFYGIYAAVVEGNIFLMLTAFMSILAEFLPILFANVPYNLTQTLAAHIVCARVSLSILALMLITVIGSLFIKWPEMPVDPRSIAGSMFYVSESRMLEDFEGLSKLNSKERAQRVKELGRRYFYGSVTGNSGKRMGVESVESVEDTAYTGGHWLLPRQRHDEDPDHEEADDHFQQYFYDQQLHQSQPHLQHDQQQHQEPVHERSQSKLRSREADSCGEAQEVLQVPQTTQHEHGQAGLI